MIYLQLKWDPHGHSHGHSPLLPICTRVRRLHRCIRALLVALWGRCGTAAFCLRLAYCMIRGHHGTAQWHVSEKCASSAPHRSAGELWTVSLFRLYCSVTRGTVVTTFLVACNRSAICKVSSKCASAHSLVSCSQEQDAFTPTKTQRGSRIENRRCGLPSSP